MTKLQLFIRNKDILYYPIVVDGITWETDRAGAPGKLSFTIVKDEKVDFQEGNPVGFSAEEKQVFYGFVFSKKRSRDGTIQVTAYDQLRYLKNKDTYIYENKTAGELVQMLAADFRLEVGEIVSTGYTIPYRVEDNKTLLDMIQGAIDLTLMNRKKLYVLYDQYGKIMLCSIEDMKLDYIATSTTAEDFNYTSSIDNNTYNRVKLSYANEESGKREIFLVSDSKHMNEWGVLQLFETIDDPTIGTQKAEALLSLYNEKTRQLTISNAFGDIRVRGGSSIIVKLALGDVDVQQYMIVERVKHAFKSEQHTMDMTLRGGGGFVV